MLKGGPVLLWHKANSGQPVFPLPFYPWHGTFSPPAVPSVGRGILLLLTCPRSLSCLGRRPFSLPCLHCSPPSQVTCQHLLSTSAALYPLISSSISGFWCPFKIHLLFFFLAQTFFRASKTVFFFHSWSNCIAVKLCNRFSTFCWRFGFEMPEKKSCPNYNNLCSFGVWTLA